MGKMWYDGCREAASGAAFRFSAQESGRGRKKPRRERRGELRPPSRARQRDPPAAGRSECSGREARYAGTGRQTFTGGIQIMTLHDTWRGPPVPRYAAARLLGMRRGTAAVRLPGSRAAAWHPACVGTLRRRLHARIDNHSYAFRMQIMTSHDSLRGRRDYARAAARSLSGVKGIRRSLSPVAA